MAILSLLLLTAPLARALPHPLRGEGGSQAPAAPDSPPRPAPREALMVFAQHRLPESSWTALFAALRANLPEVAAQFPTLDANPELIRGDALPFGEPAPKAIAVYLRGDCRAPLLPSPFPSGEALGWVLMAHAQIESVIHVECTAIGEELSRSTERMSPEQRTAAMSEAIARVVLHEWVHIATQSAAHERQGIGKARFGVNDLLAPERDAERVRGPFVRGPLKDDAARVGASPGGGG